MMSKFGDILSKAILGAEKPPIPSRYRIRQIGEVFYPEYDTRSIWGWEVIHNNGRDIIGFDSAVSFQYGVYSEETAGQLVNNHSQLFSEGKVIWEG